MVKGRYFYGEEMRLLAGWGGRASSGADQAGTGVVIPIGDCLGKVP